MSEFDSHFPDTAGEISEPTKQVFVSLVEYLVDKSGVDNTYESIVAGPWPVPDGRRLSVYLNNGENHTSSHEVTITDTVLTPSGAETTVDEVYACPFYGNWTKQTRVHDDVEKRLIELSMPSWEVNPFNPNPSAEALAAEEDRQATLFQLEMARADTESFGLQDVDEAAITEINLLMSELLSSLQ